MLKTFEKLPPEKQHAILNAAAGVFAQKGYYQANVADICKKAGISNGALYKYFKNKEALYIKVFESHIERMTAHFRRYYKLMETTDRSFFNLIEDLVNQLPLFVESEHDYLKIYHDLGSPSMDPLTSKLSRSIEESAWRFWFDLLERGKKRGEIRREVDSDVAAYMMDNHFTLFLFSCISEHYARRFEVYFQHHAKQSLTMKTKVALMKRSLRQLLSK
jgi:TetR/AcrR family transcriptional regulator